MEENNINMNQEPQQENAPRQENDPQQTVAPQYPHDQPQCPQPPKARPKKRGVGGYVVVELTEIIPTAKYVSGLRYSFNGFYIFYSCFKMSLFCFFISSISAFNGYYARGGSLGVGWSSTRSIVVASILILMFDLIVTQLMLY